MDPDSFSADVAAVGSPTPEAGGPFVPALETPPRMLPKARVWTVFVVFVITVILLLTVSVVIVLGFIASNAGGAIGNQTDLELAVQKAVADPRAMFLGGMAAAAVLLFMSLVPATLSPVPWKERLNLHRPQISAVGWIAALVGVPAFGFAFDGCQGLNWIPDSSALESISSAIQSAEGVWFLMAFLVVGIMPGISEELMFRGYIQTRLAERWRSPVAILITSLFFGIIHFDPVHSLYAMAIGIFLGCLTVWTRSIIPAMACHSFNNTLSVFGAAYAPWLDSMDSVPANAALISTGVIIIATSIWYLRSYGTGRNVLVRT
jgi:uncharacterized protein